MNKYNYTKQIKMKNGKNSAKNNRIIQINQKTKNRNIVK